jgi:hypothetical protein
MGDAHNGKENPPETYVRRTGRESVTLNWRTLDVLTGE